MLTGARQQKALHQSMQGKGSIAANPVDYGPLEKDILALRSSLDMCGCAVPTVMSTKCIPDDRARLATIRKKFTFSK